ncbi:hypothetical protein [Flaviflexus equikiangi]|uniref:O-antigen ligase domain-containing protein n=1 Tax=Flaviflexus equikiangi TaxID=2758573 RepID=A0ABS2TFH4_9ACTO|nr:hypothetical protein [Flaviflexus equikiangi]MBM9433410.1 hypothetical protein [Flaviflexus equikiangi]
MGSYFLFFGGILVATLSSTLAHGLEREFFVNLAGIIASTIFVLALLQFHEPSKILDGVAVGLRILILGSLIWWIYDPISSLENSRFRGVMENANTFGFICALTCYVLLTRRRLTALDGLTLLALFALLFWSGSRASLIFLLLSIIALLFIRERRMGASLTILALIFGAAYLLANGSVLDAEILRPVNTRSDGWGLAGDILSEHPLFGVGVAVGESIPIAGTWASAAAWGGWIAVIGVTIAACFFLISSLRFGGLATGFAVSVLGYAVFESWMLSLSGPTALLVIAIWVALAQFPARLLNVDPAEDIASSDCPGTL